MKYLRLSFFIGLFLSFSSAEALSRNIVLVPGFFNSVILGHVQWEPGPEYHPYWGGDIAKTLAKKGDHIFIVDTFDPLGSIEENGNYLIHYLEKLNQSREWQQRETILIAHSAGGLYSLYALSHLALDNVSHLVTIGTPYQGVDLVGNVIDWPVISDWVPLDSLKQLTPSRVKEVLNTIRLKTVPEITVFAGQQKVPFILDVNNPLYLSWPLVIFSQIIDKPSDGMVATDSAFARDVVIKDINEQVVPLGRWPQLVPLDHYEQVQDYRIFKLLGTDHLGYIRSQQRQFYSDLLEIL